MSDQFFMNPRATTMPEYYTRLVRTFSVCAMFVGAVYLCVYKCVCMDMHACTCITHAHDGQECWMPFLM